MFNFIHQDRKEELLLNFADVLTSKQANCIDISLIKVILVYKFVRVSKKTNSFEILPQL